MPEPSPPAPAAGGALPDLAQIERELAEAELHVKQFEIHIANASREQQAVKKASLSLSKELSQAAKGLKKTPAPAELVQLQRRVQDLKLVLPETRSVFARLMLGRVNLKLWNKEERDRLRAEHHKFKFRTNIIFIALPVIILYAHYYLRFVWADTHWMNILHQAWLVYLYSSLALRENILWVNGSNVQAWWIYHHYFAAFGSVMLITWPPTEIYARIAPQWQVFLLYQGLVQVVQLWYQQKRDYANRALGKTMPMDVTFSETLTDFPRELLMLAPLVIIAHLWQITVGLYLLRLLFTEMKPFEVHWTNYVEQVQCFVCGVVVMLLGTGNLVTTLLTLWRKSQHKKIN